ncbi:MAG: alpha/beta hydrolase [Deltaproteobacteria bacterium]|nr:alpha/beta hydrolase [Deltaproteobacteria bacterium]
MGAQGFAVLPTAARLRRWLRLIVTTVAVLYVLQLVALFALQRKLVFMPPRPAPIDARDGIEALRVGWRGGTIPALWLPAAPGAPTLVYLHGNAEQVAGLNRLARRVHGLGLGFFAPEYPGYGLSEGDGVGQDTAVEASAAAIAALLARADAPRGPIVLFGRSLGSGVACQLASRGIGDALVLVSPFTSVADRAAELYPWVPVRWLLRDPFDSAAVAAQIGIPTWIVHGDADQVIPVAMGRALAAAISGAKVEIVVGAGHNDILRKDGVLEALAAFARSQGRDACAPAARQP